MGQHSNEPGVAACQNSKVGAPVGVFEGDYHSPSGEKGAASMHYTAYSANPKTRKNPVLRPDPTAEKERKTFATLQATAALRGYRLDRIDDDTGGHIYVLTRWALTKQLRTLDDVRAFFVQVGAKHAV